MDTFSYLLGKQAGGGGGGSDLILGAINVGSNMFPPTSTQTEFVIDWTKHFDTSTIQNFSSLFSNNNKITSVDFTLGNTSSLKSIEYMFRSCTSLKSIIFRSINTSNVTSMSNMFNGCNQLEHLDIRTFTFNPDVYSQYMFNGIPRACEIIVKSQTEKDFILGLRSDFTNIKTVDEL